MIEAAKKYDRIVQIGTQQRSQAHYQKAVEIIRGFGQREGIRALDSLQLASALDVHDAKFLSADRLLSGLALKMGFNVLRI